MKKSLVSRLIRRKAVVLGVSLVVLVGLAWFVNMHISLERVVMQENRLRDVIQQYPWRSYLVGFIIYTGLSLIPGTGGKAIIYAWLFGFWQAMVIVMIGLSTAAMLIFSLSRYLFREYVEHRYASFVSLMNRHMEREGALYLLTLRMAHAPFSIINPVSGASCVSSWTFLWTTVVGLLPGTAVWAYVGIRLPSLRELAISGPISLINLPLISALAASALLPLLFRWILMQFGVPANRRAVPSNEPDKPGVSRK